MTERHQEVLEKTRELPLSNQDYFYMYCKHSIHPLQVHGVSDDKESHLSSGLFQLLADMHGIARLQRGSRLGRASAHTLHHPPRFALDHATWLPPMCYKSWLRHSRAFLTYLVEKSKGRARDDKEAAYCAVWLHESGIRTD